jgi:hypothetical protein
MTPQPKTCMNCQDIYDIVHLCPRHASVDKLYEAAKAISAEWVDSDELIEHRKRWGDKDGQTARILALRKAIQAYESKE